MGFEAGDMKERSSGYMYLDQTAVRLVEELYTSLYIPRSRTRWLVIIGQRISVCMNLNVCISQGLLRAERATIS